MDSLKSFFDGLRNDFVKTNWDNRDLNEFQEQLGMFYWNRGGKRFVKFLPKKFRTFEKIKKNADVYVLPESSKDYRFLVFEIKCEHRMIARDFLDALACLGEEKVKELMEELK